MSCHVDMKVVMLGQSACGKTSLVERFIYNRFNANYQATIGAAFGARRMKVEGRDICVGLWDTAGSERYEAMSHMYYRDAKAAVICYDITNAESAERAKFWLGEIQKHEQQCRIWLCGTKLDLVMEDPKTRQVDIHDMNDYAETQIGGRVVETSSKTGKNVEELFTAVVQDYAKDLSGVLPPTENSSFSLSNGKLRKLSKCCHG